VQIAAQTNTSQTLAPKSGGSTSRVAADPNLTPTRWTRLDTMGAAGRIQAGKRPSCPWPSSLFALPTVRNQQVVGSNRNADFDVLEQFAWATPR
jgi:hypothetical protein